MKKVLVLALMLAASAASLFAGGQSQGSSGSGAVKLTALFVKHALTRDVNEMQWLADLQKANNVSVEWQQISADWGQKKSALFASGSIPDMVFNATADSDFVVYNGLFEDLTPLIETHAPNIKKMFADHPEIKSMVTTMDGKIYALPTYLSVWPDAASTMLINQQWLDRVGKKIPTNWDELKDVLIAFRDQDANGNGDKNDEVAMDFRPAGDLRSFTELLGSLGMPVSDYGSGGYFVENARVKNFYVDERFRELMIFMRDLWAENLINKETLTQDYSQYQALTRSDGKVAKVGFTWAWESADKFGNALAGQYVSIPQLKRNASYAGPVYWTYDRYGINYYTNRISLSAQCKNKEAAIKFMDSFYNPLVSMQVLFGGMNDKDKGIKDNGNGTYTVLPPADPAKDPGTWKWSESFADFGPIYMADDLKLTLGSDMQTVLKEKSVYKSQQTGFDPKTNIYPQGFMKYSAADLNAMSMNDANLGSILSQWARWMVGEGNIQADWNNYVKSALDAGLSQNLEIRQRAFDTYLKTLR